MTIRSFVQRGVRYFKRNRLLATCGIGIVACGLGISSSALTVLWNLSNPQLRGLRPSGYATVGEAFPGARLQPISWRVVKELEGRVLETGMGTYGVPQSFTASYGQSSFNISLAAVSANLFEEFVEPLAAGTSFSRSDDNFVGTQPPIILSFKTAIRVFGSPSQAIGRSLRIKEATFHVVGVAARSFEGLFQTPVDAWIPPSLILIGLQSAGMFAGDAWQSVPAFYLVAANRHSRNQELASAVVRLLRQSPARMTLSASPGLDIDPARTAKLKMWAGLAAAISAALVLVGGFSLGGLVFARTPRLFEEIRLKRILGAKSVHLFADLATGPASVVTAGVICAIVFSIIMMVILKRRVQILEPSTTWLVKNALLALVAQLPIIFGIVIGTALMPVLRLLRDSGIPQLSYSGTTRQLTRLLDVIVATQVVIFICACVVAMNGLQFATLLGRQALGYDPENRTVLVIGTTRPGGIVYHTDSRGGAALQLGFNRMMERLSHLPGVRGLAVAQAAPLDVSVSSMLLSDTGPSSNQHISVSFNGITPDYFDTLATPLTEGRRFVDGILAGDPTEAIVNETLRRQLWPDQNPIGKVVRLEHPFGTTYNVTIVAVATDQKLGGPKESASPLIYLPMSGNLFQNLPRYVIIHGRVPAFRLEAAANEELAAGFPGMAVVRSYRIDEGLRSLLTDDQIRLIFAAAALAAVSLIALLSLYDSLSYFVNSKRRELAVRVCCGATPVVIFRTVMAKAMRASAPAVLISGLCIAPLQYLLATEWLGSQFWSISTSVAAGGFCVAVLFFVAALPARRASRFERTQGLANALSRT